MEEITNETSRTDGVMDISYEEIEQLALRIVEQETALRKGKGKEYSRGHVLGNFRRVAEMFKRNHLDTVDVIMVYMAKHWDSVCSYVDTRQEGVEPIEGRILDLRNYLLLLLYAIETEKRARGDLLSAGGFFTPNA